MFLSSDVVCLKDQPHVLGIVEAVGNEDEAEADDLDPNDVGLEIFWPSKPLNACTTVETAKSLDLVDRAFISGDIVMKKGAAVPLVGSVQRLESMLDLRQVYPGKDKPSSRPTLHNVNAQHLQHLQRFKRGFPCVVQHDFQRQGTHPTLYQVMDWHVDLLVGFEDGCVCLVIDAYAEDILSDPELDCINEESPFYPGQILRSKGKRGSFFKDKPYIQGRWKRTHKEGTILHVVTSAVDVLPVTQNGALDAQRLLSLLPDAPDATAFGGSEFAIMAGPLPAGVTEAEVREQWTTATSVKLQDVGGQLYAMLDFPSHEEVHRAIVQGPLATELPADAAHPEDPDPEPMDEAMSPTRDVPAEDDDAASADSHSEEAAADAPAEGRKGSKPASGPKAKASHAVNGGQQAAMSLRLHPSEVHSLDFFWYATLSLGDFVTPICYHFLSLKDHRDPPRVGMDMRRPLPEQQCAIYAPELKTNAVVDFYNWHQKERIKWYRSELKNLEHRDVPPVFEVIGRRTTCTVMWQDGTLEEDIPSTQLMPRTAQRFDFIPKDFVYTATLGGGAPNRPARTGIVQRVNQQERTCDVQWLYDAGGPKLETGISCYDIELLNVRAQDIVLRLPHLSLEPGQATPPAPDAATAAAAAAPAPKAAAAAAAAAAPEAMQVDAAQRASGGGPGDSPPYLVDDRQPHTAAPTECCPSDPAPSAESSTPAPADSTADAPADGAGSGGGGGGGVGGALWTWLQRLGGFASRALCLNSAQEGPPAVGEPPRAVYVPVRCGQIVQFLDDGMLEVVWHDGLQDVVPYAEVVVVRPEWTDNNQAAGGNNDGNNSEKSWETLSEDAEDLPAEETADAPAPAPAESGAAEGAGEAEEEAREAAEGPAEREPVLGGVGQGGYAEDDEDTVDMIESSFQVLDKFEAHAYAADPQVGNPGRALPKRVRQEWKTLATSLPKYGIAVRASSENLQLLKALVSGPRFTPYYRGIYAFDVMLPNDYPAGPPKVKFHAYGMRINPNLYEDGFVCLSLLGTWTGHKQCERWSENSNLLQVLLSIQSLVLCAEPYYNEPGFDKQLGSPEGEISSRSYNEQVLRLKLAHLVEMTRSPCADFTEEVRQHTDTVLRKTYEVVQQLCQPEPWRPPASPNHRCDAEGLLGPATGGLVASLRNTLMPALESVLRPPEPPAAAAPPPEE